MQKHHSIEKFNPMHRSGIRCGDRSKDSGEMEARRQVDQDVQMLEAIGLQGTANAGQALTHRSQLGQEERLRAHLKSLGVTAEECAP